MIDMTYYPGSSDPEYSGKQAGFSHSYIELCELIPAVRHAPGFFNKINLAYSMFKH